MKSNPLRQIKTAAFLLGAWASFAQLLAVREFLAVFFGNELIIALLLGAWFAGIAAGAWFGRRRRIRMVTFDWSWVTWVLPAVGFLQIAAIRSWRWLTASPDGVPAGLDSMGLAFLLLMFPAGWLVGLAFPSLTAAAGAAGSGRPGSPAGTVYGMEAAGSLAAGLLYTLFLAGSRDSFLLWAAAIVTNLLLAAAGLLPFPGRAGGRKGALVLLILATGLVFPAGLPPVIRCFEEIRWRVLAPGYRLLESRTSRYQHLALGERDGQFVLYQNGLPGPPFPDPYRTDIKAHLLMNQPGQLRRVLLAGGGMEGMAQRMLQYPDVRVDLVMSDPEQLDMLWRHLPEPESWPLRSPRFRASGRDPTVFLAGSDGVFDLILLAVPPPVTVAASRYYGGHFLRLCRERLAEKGALAIELEGTDTVLDEAAVNYGRSLFRALREVFPVVRVVPGNQWIFLCGGPAAPLSLDPAELARRYGARGLDGGAGFSAGQFQLLLPPERVEWLARELTAAGEGGAARQDSSGLLLLYLQIWLRKFGGGAGNLTGWLLAAGPGIIILLLLAVAAAGAAGLMWVRCWRGELPARNILLDGAMCILGGIGMGQEIVLLIQFQVLAGSLFHMLGLLIGCFMLGLAAGAFLAGRLAGRHRWRMILLAAIPGAQIILNGWIGTGWASSPGMTFLQMAISGGLTGAFFPLACQLRIGEAGDWRAAAARLDAWDHAGALAGCLATGLLLLPVLGREGTCLCFGMASGLILAGIRISRADCRE